MGMDMGTQCRALLASIGISQTKPNAIFTDNQSAMRLAVNPEFHSRTKHVALKFHFLCEQLVLCSIEIHYLPYSSANCRYLDEGLNAGSVPTSPRLIDTHYTELKWENQSINTLSVTCQ